MSNSDEREVRAILTDLQAEIRRQQLARGGPIAPPDPLARVRERQTINPHLPIGWPEMPRGIFPKLVAYAQKLTRRLLRWYINPIVAQQNDYNAAATDLLAGLQSTVEALAQRLVALESAGRTQDERLGQLAAAHAAHVAQVAQLEPQLEAARLRLQRLENWRRNPEPRPALPAPAEPNAIDTFLLGAAFRNQVQMAPTLRDYDDLFVTLPDPTAPVLDIGCGRGDFVAHLRQLGLAAYGIDLDADALAIGRAQGLDLRQLDAYTHLHSLADNSLAAVVMIQVIEHLAPADLLALLRLIERKLLPDGFIIAETINPSCLFALSNWYLMDPSHRTPMHNETTQFLLRQAGFERIQIRFLHPVPEGGQLRGVAAVAPPDQALAPLLAHLQHNFDQLNHLLYGPQDYAAIAYRPEV